MVEAIFGFMLISICLGLLGFIVLGRRTAPDKTFEQYEHHGVIVWVRKDLAGKHRDHCLCYDCEYFHPNQPDNCPLAQTLYENCVKHDMVTPVWECPDFRHDPFAHCRPWNQ